MDIMDKQKSNGRFDWLPAAMPGVARLMRDKRREHGDAHVNLCWKRGVVELQPGWFYAREGALAVGAPFPGDEFDVLRQAQAASGGALVLIKLPAEVVAHGA